MGRYGNTAGSQGAGRRAETFEEEPSFFDSAIDSAVGAVSNIAEAISEPAGTVLNALSYLDKPRGALAGGVKAALDNSDIIEGIKSGWEDNTSWGEVAIPEDVREEHPYLSAAAGIGMDVLADPLWLVPPAKAAKMAGAVGKATGITDNLVNPAVNAIRNSDAGRRAISFGEDVLGRNRVNEAGIDRDFNYGRGQDNLVDSDLTDELAGIRTMGDTAMSDMTRYIEAAERPQNPLSLTPQMETDIMDSFGRGNMAGDIASGVYSRENALDTLRRNVFDEDIPDYLLQQHQVDDILSGRGVSDYVYRDQVLSSIQDPNLRAAIQSVGDKIVERNKYYTEQLRNSGLIGDDALVHFQDGSHYRRSYEKYETPEEFLEAVRKNGTPEEWRSVYADYQRNHGASSMGTSPLHKINRNDFIKRQRLSSETLEKLGLIDDAQYRVADTFNRSSKALRESEYLSSVASRFGKAEDEAAILSRDLPESRTYVPIPESRAYGDLAGMWVPRDVANQVMKRIGTKPDNINKTWQNLVSIWKVGKLANPASIMRNFYSGLPMANVFGKVPMAKMPKLMMDAANAMRLGKKSQLYREYVGSGAKESKLTKEELTDILEGETEGVINSIKQGNLKEGAAKGFRKAGNFGMKYFNKPDDFWRLVVFKHYRDQGMSVKEAGDMARKSLLDYQNTPEWISSLAKTGVVPFARFPFHAGKATAKALWERPANVTAYYKPSNQTDDDTREILPSYLKPQNLLPIGKGTRTVDGKEQTVHNNIDVSYILPFASDISIGNPLVDAIQLARTGKNGIGQQIIRPGMSDADKVKAYAEFAANSLFPTVASPYTLNRIYNGATGQVDEKGRQYDLGWSLAQTLGGVKNVPVNTDEMYKNRKTGYESDMRNVQAEINRIKRNKSMSEEQKAEKIAEYRRQKKQLEQEKKELRKTYKRLKEKEKEG